MNFSLRRHPSPRVLVRRPADLAPLLAPLLLPLVGLAWACAPRATGEAQSDPQKVEPGAPCRPLAPSTQPPFAAAPLSPSPGLGEVWLTIDLPLAALEREVERYVPRTLAQEEDRPIGAPGQVTYRVTRGKPKLYARQGRVTATLPVKIDLSLCKPFGSLCIGYGSCTPAYDVKASWDLTLSAQHELPAVHLSQKVTEGCTVGIDVTDHVTRVVKDQLRDVEAQVESRLPSLSPWVDRAIAELTRPSLLAVGTCVALSPTELLLAGPVTSGERISLGVGLTGTMIEAACDAPPHPGRGLPVRRQDAPTVSPHVQLRQHFPQGALRTALEQAVTRAATANLTLTVSNQVLAEGGVLLELELGGSSCGTSWVELKLGVEADQVTIATASVHGSDLDPARKAEIETALAGPLDLASLAPRWVSELAVEERTDILGTMLRERSALELEVTAPEVRDAEVMSVQDGIWVLTNVRSRLGLKAHARPTR